MEKSQVTILGARGGVPVSGMRYSRYGGATACVLLETESEVLIFDAGTGILNLPEEIWKQHRRVHLFVSHFHMDHLLGIPMCPMLFDEKAEVIFYAQNAERMKAAIDQMMQSPLWPVGTEAFAAKISYVSLGDEDYRIGDNPVIVSNMPVSHPGGCLAYRAEWENHRIVYATDCELDEEGCRRLEAFAYGAQLLIVDAQYTKEEYQRCRGYGHSDMETAASLIVKSEVAQGLLFHHAPTRTDEQLGQMEQFYRKKEKRVGVAKEGDKIKL